MLVCVQTPNALQQAPLAQAAVDVQVPPGQSAGVKAQLPLRQSLF